MREQQENVQSALSLQIENAAIHKARLEEKEQGIFGSEQNLNEKRSIEAELKEAKKESANARILNAKQETQYLQLKTARDMALTRFSDVKLSQKAQKAQKA